MPDDTDSTDRRKISNPERGCGHLKPGKAYVRGVVGSPDGVLPSFVELDPYVPFREVGTDGSFTRGYQQLDGVTTQLALEDITDFQPRYPGDADREMAVENMQDRGLQVDVQQPEATHHVARVRARGTEGADHWGSVPAAQQNDLLMRAGKTHYPDPGDFIQEAVQHGISKAIPVSERQEPPGIQPGVTRMWIVHPDTQDGWAVIGYAYLQEIVFTEPEDGHVPAYVQEYQASGKMDVVDIEDPHDSGPDSALDDFQDGHPVRDADTDSDGQDDGSAPECYACGETLPESWSDQDGNPPDCPHCGDNPLPPVGSDDDDDDAGGVAVQASDAPGRDVETADQDGQTGVDPGDIPDAYGYNELKSMAAHMGADVSAQPSREELVAGVAASADDVDEVKRVFDAAVNGEGDSDD